MSRSEWHVTLECGHRYRVGFPVTVPGILWCAECEKIATVTGSEKTEK